MKGALLYVKQVGFERAKEVVKNLDKKLIQYGSSHVRTKQVVEIVKSLQIMEDYFNVNSVGYDKALTLAVNEYLSMNKAGINIAFNRYSDGCISLERLHTAIEHFKIVHKEQLT